MAANNTYLPGNNLDNIITASTGSQTLNGKGGNDILTGGAGEDVFVFTKGSDKDLITDFKNGVDQVRLDGYGFTTLGQVKSKMSQSGANTVLDLGGGDQITFKNHKIADFISGDFALALDKSKLSLSFADEFNSLDLWNGTTGTWRTVYQTGEGVFGRSLPSNKEEQVYVDLAYTGTGNKALGLNPFSIKNGILTITAEKASAKVAALSEGYEITSGQLNTKFTHAQTYGYFEIRADLPDQKGMWPAFWLLPVDGGWPPELDVMEQLGKDPDTIYMTSHSQEVRKKGSGQDVVHVEGASTGFHTYGVLWAPDYLTFYIDGVEVAKQDTPADMHKPMYMLVNLAVGGSWAGATNSTFVSDHYDIDYVRAYTLNGVGGVTAPANTNKQVIAQAATIAAAHKAAEAAQPAPPQTAPKPDSGIVVDIFDGKAGGDKYVYKVGDLTKGASGVQAKFHDFGGAGGWSATNNDWISFTGFGKSSSLTWLYDKASDPKVGYYKIHDTATKTDYVIMIESLNGKHLTAGDFNFY